jgi:hypothetical protein
MTIDLMRNILRREVEAAGFKAVAEADFLRPRKTFGGCDSDKLTPAIQEGARPQ